MEDAIGTLKAELNSETNVNSALDQDDDDEDDDEAAEYQSSSSHDYKMTTIKQETVDGPTGKSKKLEAVDGCVETKPPRAESGYSTSALDPAIFSMLSSLVKQKITKDKPHYCMFCGKLFVSGSGLYIHYYRHKATNSLTQECRPRSVKTEPPATPPPPPSSSSSKRAKNCATVSAAPVAATVVPKRRRNAAVNGKIAVTKTRAVAAASKVLNIDPALIINSGNAYVKPFPTKILPAKTMRMLQDLLKQKITPENPHLCNVCNHPFYSGCGIYIHYLKHAKKSTAKMTSSAAIKASTAKDSAAALTARSLANAKRRIRRRIAAARARGADPRVLQSLAVASLPSPSKSKTKAQFSGVGGGGGEPILDTKTLLMLRDIANRISPEDPHVCEICEHAFYNARGIQAHYLKHAKQKLLDRKIKPELVEDSQSSSPPPTPIVAAKPKLGKKRIVAAADPAIKKPSPLHWLRPTVLHMLQAVVKSKISTENPHTCTFCPKVFVRGTGLYFHYLQHKGATRSFAGMNMSPKTSGAGGQTKAVASARASKGVATTPSKTVLPAVTKAKTTPKAVQLNTPTVAVNNTAFPGQPPPKRTQTYAVKSLYSTSPPMSTAGVTPPSSNNNTNNDIVTAPVDNDDDLDVALTGRRRDCTFVLRQLEHNTKKLLYHLTKDVQVLQSFGWPQKDAISIVGDILAACNVTPMRRSSHYPSRKLECLRNNVQKLIKFCIRDEVMVAKGWKDKLVDDAVKEIIAAEDFSGQDQDRVTF